VALIKTQKTPFDPLGLRLTDPMVGDEVFAIGSPLGDQFNGTFTRGVLSGFRDSGNNRFLQSDVSITHGSSGGPLVDANGTVVGIAVGLAAVRGGNMNFFIPIADALARLGIEIK
jgi:S1-C subfamily serine protease